MGDVSQTVQVVTPEGKRGTEAYVVEGGLAVTRGLGTELHTFTVTHLESGRRVAGRYDEVVIAKAAMRALLLAGDWTRPTKQIIADDNLHELSKALGRCS